MNLKQIIILIIAIAAAAMIVWHDLPISFPFLIYKVLMLFLKLFAVVALAVIAYVFVSRKKRDS